MATEPTVTSEVPAGRQTVGGESHQRGATLPLLAAPNLATALARARSRQVWQQVRHRLRTQFPALVKIGAISWGIGWLGNLVMLAFAHGSTTVPSGSAAAGRGNVVWGTAFWAATSAVVSALVVYRLQVGKEQFGRDLRALPRFARFARWLDGDRALVHLLWGFAGAMVFSIALGRSISGVAAVGTTFLLLTALRPIVVSIGLRVWRWTAARLGFGRDRPPSAATVTIGALGTGGALFVGFVLSSTTARFVVGATAAAVALAVSRGISGRQAAGATALVALVLGPVIVGVAGRAASAVPAPQEQSAATLSGTVTTARGDGVAGIVISVRGAIDDETATDDAGRYELDLPIGAYTVTPSDPEDDRTAFDPDDASIDLVDDTTVDFVVQPAGGSGADPDAEGDDVDAEPVVEVEPSLTVDEGYVRADFVLDASVADLDTGLDAEGKPLPADPDASTTSTEPARPEDDPRDPNRNTPGNLGTPPVEADCLFYRGPEGCYYDTGYIEFSVDRRILKVGDRVTGSTSFDLVFDQAKYDECLERQRRGVVEYCSYASWSWAPPPGMAAVGGSPATPTGETVLVGDDEYDTVTCEAGKDIGSATCEWIALSPTNAWVTGFGATLHFPGSRDYTDGDFLAVLGGDFAVIEGFVRDRNGIGVPGAEITIDGDGKTFTTTTNPQGYYFQFVPKGTYSITVTAPVRDGEGQPGVDPPRVDVEVDGPEQVDFGLGSDVGEATTADGGPLECDGGLFERLGCLADDPGGLLLAGLLTFGMVPAGATGGALGGVAAEGHAAPRDPLSYTGSPDDVWHQMRTDLIHWYREEHPDTPWEQLRAEFEADFNRRWANYTLTGHAAKPIHGMQSAEQWVGGFTESLWDDLASGDARDRLSMLLGSGWRKGSKFVGDVWGMMAREVETHGVFSIFTMPPKLVVGAITETGGNAKAFMDGYAATDGMSDAQREQWFLDHAASVRRVLEYEALPPSERPPGPPPEFLDGVGPIPLVDFYGNLVLDVRAGDDQRIADASIDIAAFIGFNANELSSLRPGSTGFDLDPPRHTTIEFTPIQWDYDQNFSVPKAMVWARAGGEVPLRPEIYEGLGIETRTVMQAYEQALEFTDHVDGVPVDPIVTEFKLGNVYAYQLRQTGDYLYKPNFVADKSLLPGEEAFMPKWMRDDPPKPGEVVNYEPTHLPDPDHPLYARIVARQKQADAWSPGQVKHFDGADPGGYGPMYDESGLPVRQAEAWKAEDGRIHVRYERQDGTWSEAKPLAGDTDTFRVEGSSSRLTPEERARLPHVAGEGTIPGEGDFGTWVSSSFSADGRVADGVDPQLLLKQYEVGLQAMDQPVIRVDHTGAHLVQPDIAAEMEQLRAAIRTQPTGAWSATELAQLESLGLR